MLHLAVAVETAGLDRIHTRRSQSREAAVQIRVESNLCQVMVIEAGSPQALGVHPEPERFDEM
jgi:hypothetical protein